MSAMGSYTVAYSLHFLVIHIMHPIYLFIHLFCPFVCFTLFMLRFPHFFNLSIIRFHGIHKATS